MTSVVIDFAERVHKFIGQDLTVKQILFEYYLNFIPWINGLLWPLFALVAVIFFTSRMAKNSEFISILNAGVSFNRILVPYLIASSFISIIFWYGINYVVPESNRAKADFETEYKIKNRKKTRSTDFHCFIAKDSKIFARYYKKRDTTIQHFRIEQFDDSGNLIKMIKSKKAKLTSLPNTWTLTDYVIRKISDTNESIIVAEGEKMDTIVNITPEDFILNVKQMEIMTTDDLEDYIRREKERGIDNTKKYVIELHRRTADPFTIIILTLIGVAIATRKVRGGIGLHLAMGVIIGSSYVILSKFSVTFAHNFALSAGLGVWIPNIFFFGIAILLIRSAQK